MEIDSGEVGVPAVAAVLLLAVGMSTTGPPLANLRLLLLWCWLSSLPLLDMDEVEAARWWDMA
jgi:hypothetical protein